MWMLNGSYKPGTRGGLLFSGPVSPLLLGYTPPLSYLSLFLLSLLLPFLSPFQGWNLKHCWAHLSDKIMAFKTLWKSSMLTVVKHDWAVTDPGAALLENSCYLENNVIKEEEQSHRLTQWWNIKLSDVDYPHSLIVDQPQCWGWRLCLTTVTPLVVFSNVPDTFSRVFYHLLDMT